MNYIKFEKLFLFIIGLLLPVSASHATNPLLNVNWEPPQWEADPGKTDRDNLLDLLAGLETAAAENEWLWILELHFNSMQRLIQTYPPSSQQTTELINLFSNPDTGAGLSPYTLGNREFLIAYDSQAGGVLSYVRCTLPANWDPQRRYPLYVWARGGGPTPYPGDVTDRYTDQINGVTIPGTPSAVYKDGYTIMPGGLGGRTYLDDNGGLDFIEGIDTFRSKFHTDPRRLYMGGFSSGGKGTYLIGSNYMDKYHWAALGMCAVAVGLENVNQTQAEPLMNTPIWMAVGADDNTWIDRSRALRDLLISMGHPPGHYEEKTSVGHTWLWDFQISMYNFMREHEYIYPGGPPPTPENFRATSVRDNGATFAWSLPPGLEEAELRLEWAIGTGNFLPFPYAYLPPGTTSWRDDYLSANTRYRFRIRAYDKSGESESSPVIEFTTGQNMEADWAGYPIEEDGHVNTGDFLGWIYPYGDWVWIWPLGKFAYAPESHVSHTGAWAYVMR